MISAIAAARPSMRRLALLLPVLAVLLGGSVFAGIASGAPSKNYTVTRTFGPYNSAAALGQPGSVPDGRPSPFIAATASR